MKLGKKLLTSNKNTSTDFVKLTVFSTKLPYVSALESTLGVINVLLLLVLCRVAAHESTCVIIIALFLLYFTLCAVGVE